MPQLKNKSAHNIAAAAALLRLPKEIKVCGVGEVKCQPDLHLGILQLTSIKGSLTEAKESIQKRLPYVLQTFGNYKIKKKDTTMTEKEVPSESGSHKYMYEIHFLCDSQNTCTELLNFLLEKLTSSVATTLGPYAVCSISSREYARHLALKKAIANARDKAAIISDNFGYQSSRMRSFTEESVKESHLMADLLPTLIPVKDDKNLYAVSTVSVLFEVN